MQSKIEIVISGIIFLIIGITIGYVIKGCNTKPIIEERIIVDTSTVYIKEIDTLKIQGKLQYKETTITMVKKDTVKETIYPNYSVIDTLLPYSIVIANQGINYVVSGTKHLFHKYEFPPINEHIMHETYDTVKTKLVHVIKDCIEKDVNSDNILTYSFTGLLGLVIGFFLYHFSK
jgi:hypothetical protein